METLHDKLQNYINIILIRMEERNLNYWYTDTLMQHTPRPKWVFYNKLNSMIIDSDTMKKLNHGQQDLLSLCS